MRLRCDELRVSWIRLDGTSKLVHRMAKIWHAIDAIRPPQMSQQFPITDDASGVLDQKLENLIRLGREMDFRVSDPNSSIDDIHLQRPFDEDWPHPFSLHWPAQDIACTSQEFAGPEGFDQEIVCSAIQGVHYGRFIVPTG